MKTFLLDTNVLLFDNKALSAFEDNEVIIPLPVLDELDTAKKHFDEIGRNARIVIRMLDELRERGSLNSGVKLGKSIIRVELNHGDNLPSGLSYDKVDNRIISVALGFKNEGKQVIVVSKDINLRVKCDALGIEAQDYTKGKVAENITSIYGGVETIKVMPEVIDELYSKGYITPEFSAYPNQFFILKDEYNESHSGIARCKNGKLQILRKYKDIMGIVPRNLEQKMAFDLLLDPDVKLVTMIGIAGSGKTLISLCSALHHILTDCKTYNRLLVSRPIQPMGKDIGFLPGPQPLDAKILTPNGWTTMGELKIGQEIITKKGAASKVIGIYPKGFKSVFKIITTDNRKTECCEDHLWYTETTENRKRKKSGSIKNTKEIIATLKNKFGKFNHRLPKNDKISFNSVELPISPYAMGVLLGEGCFGDSVNITNSDTNIIDRFNKEIKLVGCDLYNVKNTITYNIRRLENKYNKTAQKICVTNINSNETKIFNRIGEASAELKINNGSLYYYCKNEKIKNNQKFCFLKSDTKWVNPIKEILYKYGLLNKRAWEKFIPEEYIYKASINDRIALLQGLMDTDGTVKENGESSFCTTSYELAQQVVILVRSLGGQANLSLPRDRRNLKRNKLINNREVKSKHVSYEFNISFEDSDICPFYTENKVKYYMPRKFLHGSWIKSVEYVGEKEVQCILIDDPEHLYITDDFIVTHNTIEEKLLPWMQPIYDNLDFILGAEFTNSNMYEGIIQIEALTYIRGRSIPKSFILVDESQNLSAHEVKTIITRVGEDTKIVLVGDICQIDSNLLDFSDNGLSYVIEKFKEYDIAGHITLQKGERSELATLASEIL